MREAIELNLDGLVGPTHHYAGLGSGNLASQAHRHSLASPKAAALEGLDKMKRLVDLGVPQAVLPPQPRPAIETLRVLGFEGRDDEVLAAANQMAPDWLHSVYSASSMWAANAATITPAADSTDQRVHITPANLLSQFHRSLEASQTALVLKQIFKDDTHFVHHPPLPATARFADEGAANHLRLTPAHAATGIEIFVFGYDPSNHAWPMPKQFTPRQTRDAAMAIARRHRLPRERTLLLQQHPDAIDAGVFHNDVISMANESVLLYHERAFHDTPAAINRIRQCYHAVAGQTPHLIEIPESIIPLDTAVSTYLFNSQLVTRPDGLMLLLAPKECQREPRTARFIEQLVADEDNLIARTEYVEVRQSMQNGGGPACLRLRTVLSPAQYDGIHAGVKLDTRLYESLRQCIDQHYRDTLRPADLADAALIDESRRAVAAIRQLLQLPTGNSSRGT